MQFGKIETLALNVSTGSGSDRVVLLPIANCQFTPCDDSFVTGQSATGNRQPAIGNRKNRVVTAPGSDIEWRLRSKPKIYLNQSPTFIVRPS